MEKKSSGVFYWFVFAVVLFVGASVAAWYFFDLSEKRAAEITTLQNDVAIRTTELGDAHETINNLEATLEETRDVLDDTQDDLRDEKKKNDAFEEQIEKLTGTVASLDKLSKTDEELLQKYSKVYFLNENYTPSDLDAIDDDYMLRENDLQYFHGDALPFLEDMIDEAEDDGYNLKIISAYRSFDHQQDLKGEFTTVYGEGANAFSADQGYSEHQLGTAVDLTVPEVGATNESFADTEAYEWLLKNAYKYGFTLSYPEDNSFYIFEPWHWRFVGVDLATDLHRKDAHFYDWDQRKIDEYLIKIFD